MSTRALRAAGSLALALAAACGGGGAEPAAAAEGPGGADPRVRELQEAIDRGRADVVEALLPRLAPGLEVTLARARVELGRGDVVAALRELEEARARWPEDVRVAATAVELFAALGRADSAEEELRQGLALDPEAPELSRARGLLFLSRPGGAGAALQHLELAAAADPDLPYLGRPLAQARRFVARQALADGDPARAEAHLLDAVAFDPRDVDARLLLADARAALADFEGAIAVHRELLEEGHGRPEELAVLHKRAALAVLLEGRRGQALEHFREARRLGLDDEELGWGATALAEEGERLLDAGIQHYRAERFAEALAAFDEGLGWDPGSPELLHKRGMALFRQQRFAEAAEAWERTLEESAARGLSLPVPVHLDLARALRMAGDARAAREELDRYLADEPEGPWAEETREMRDRLPEEG